MSHLCDLGGFDRCRICATCMNEHSDVKKSIMQIQPLGKLGLDVGKGHPRQNNLMFIEAHKYACAEDLAKNLGGR